MAKPTKSADTDVAIEGEDKPGLTLVKNTKALVLADGKTRANVEAMKAASAVLGVPAAKTRGAKADAELLGKLRIEIQRRLDALPIDDHIKCQACGEIATMDTDSCPYCGDGGEVGTAAVAGEETPTIIEPEESDEDGEPGEEESDEDADDSDDDESGDEPDEEDATEKAVAPAKPVKGKSVGIAKKPAKPAADVDAALAVNAAELDETLAKIHELKKNAAVLSYDMGLLCRDIRDKQLFKARGHASFKAFAESELPFTRESALHLIAIVDKHSREEYALIGYAKLRLIAPVNDNAQKEELIEAAKAGATTREINAKITGKPVEAPKPRETPAAEKGDRITILGKVSNKKHIAVFHNVETGEVIKTVGKFETKGFVPNSYGQIELAPDVFLQVGLRTSGKNELTGLTISFVRPGDEQ